MNEQKGQAGHDSKSQHEQKPSAKPQRQPGVIAYLRPLAAPGTALAVAGTAWYGLLTFGAAITYEPLGVQPREIGLASGTLLAQAAVGLAAALLVMVLSSGLQWSMLWMFGQRDPPPHRSPFLLVTTAVVFLLCAPVFVLSSALEARTDLTDGRRPTSLFGSGSPWRGEIAALAWSGNKPKGFGDLPSCALYLGEAGGTAVIYDPGQKRTLRIPSSMVIVTTQRDKEQCS